MYESIHHCLDSNLHRLLLQVPGGRVAEMLLNLLGREDYIDE